MDLDYLTFNLRYNIKTNEFKVEGNLEKKVIENLIKTFLRKQSNNGDDDREPNQSEVYEIQLKSYPDKDIIDVSSNTGNKAFRDGILICYLNKYRDF